MSAGLAGVVSPYPAIFIYLMVRNQGDARKLLLAVARANQGDARNLPFA